jgi:predicted membrane metal-binding protein
MFCVVFITTGNVETMNYKCGQFVSSLGIEIIYTACIFTHNGLNPSCMIECLLFLILKKDVLLFELKIKIFFKPFAFFLSRYYMAQVPVSLCSQEASILLCESSPVATMFDICSNENRKYVFNMSEQNEFYN